MARGAWRTGRTEEERWEKSGRVRDGREVTIQLVFMVFRMGAPLCALHGSSLQGPRPAAKEGTQQNDGTFLACQPGPEVPAD